MNRHLLLILASLALVACSGSTTMSIDTSKLEEFLAVVGLEATASISNGEVIVFVDATRLDFLGDELQGIELAEHAEMAVYSVVYHTLDEFEQVEAMVVEIQFDKDAAYRVAVTREQAYDLRSGSAKATDYTALDPSILWAAALEQNQVSDWDVQYMAPEIEAAISSPTQDDVAAVVANWTTADVEDVDVQDKAISMRLDISGIADFFYDSYGKNDPTAREQVALEAALSTVDVIYGLFLRFPSLEDVAIEVYVDDTRYSTHRCSRQKLDEIGPYTFWIGGPDEDPVAILELLESP